MGLAKQTNSVGEVMEPKVTVKIFYNAQGDILDIETTVGNKTIRKAAIDLLIGPIFGGNPIKESVTLISNLRYSPEAHLMPSRQSVNNMASIRNMEHSFLYLDCGRWGGDPSAGGQRTFGLVWGQWAALCEFKKIQDPSKFGSAVAEKIDDKKAGNGINNFFQSIAQKGVEVEVIRHSLSNTQMSVYNTRIHHTLSTKAVQLDFKEVFVLIPDLHLPIISRNIPETTLNTSTTGDGLKGEGRITTEDLDFIQGVYRTFTSLVGILKAKKILRQDPDFKNRVERPRYTNPRTNEFGARVSANAKFSVVGWHKHYRKGDIFNGRNAQFELRDFLRAIQKINLKNQKVHLVQLGDMYELWIGLGRFFEESSAPKVILKGRTILFKTSAGTKPDPITPERFINNWVKVTNDALNFGPLFKAFEDSNFPHKRTFLYGNHDNYLAAHTPPSITKREKEIRRGGHYFEHGHRGDDSNRDGAIEGHYITQSVHYVKDLRNADPERRAAFITAAALSFIQNPNFFVYGMGHTHSPYMTKVIIEFKFKSKP